jgi:probable HAF family extracellular repeat protein
MLRSSIAAAPRLLRWLLCTATAGTIFAQGVTYPDLTVSPFAPGFFGVGIAPGATSSNVFGVAAQDGTFIAAVGAVVQFNGTTLHTLPALFLPGNGITLLPTGVANADGTALGISADGKIKVGTAQGGTGGSAAYWDMNNQLHSLPKGAGDDATVSALAISPTGSTIAGYVQFTTQFGSAFEAVLWTPGGTGLTRLGMPSGFESTVASAISDDAAFVAGHAIKVDRSVQPPVFQMRAVQQAPGQPIHTLPTLGGNVDTFSYGVSELGSYTVGESGTNAVLWSNLGVELFPGGGESIAYAVRLNPSSPGGGVGRAVGARTLFGENQKAVMWSLVPPRDEGPIKDILQFIYKKSIGTWELTAGYALSQNGYLVGGEGINPNGQTEGWIAVLPPILHPPRILNRVPATATLGVAFSRTTRFEGNTPIAFSAKGLPAGFQINEDTGQITGTWNDAIAVKPGRYSVTIKATNLQGTGSGTFILELQPPSSIKQLIEGHSFLPFAKPPGENTFEWSFGAGLSQNGLVAVGQDAVANDARAFRFTSAEGISALPMLSGALRTYSIAQAVSNDGNTIVGQAASPPDADGNSRSVAVVWQNTQTGAVAKQLLVRSKAMDAFGATNIGLFPAGIVSIATGVSADGSVVVGWGDGSAAGSQTFQAFRWTAVGGLQGLGWLSASMFSEAFGISADGSTIVGTAKDSGSSSVAFRWTQGSGMLSVGRLPGGNSATARAVSANGAVIAGESFINGNDTHAFRWTAGGGMVDLGVLPGDNRSGANAVSADGAIVVGFSRNGFNAPRAFIWDPANGMRDLKSVLVAGNSNLSNWTLRTADGISGDGKTITGDAINPNGDSEGYTAYLSRVVLTGAVSRKIHGATPFDIDLPLMGDPGIECRSGGASGNYQLIFTFADNLSSVGNASVTSGAGSVSSRMIDADTHKYIVNLTGVTNAQVITVDLTSVVDSTGNSSSSVPISVGILQGDTTGNGSVNSSDVSQTKLRSGQAVNTANFRTDVVVSGSINSTDVSAVKLKSGTSLSLP